MESMNPDFIFPELDFEQIVNKLKTWRDELEPQLHTPSQTDAHTQAVLLKRQIENAVHFLEFCQQHQIQPARLKHAIVLPETRSFGGEYRVMDDEDSRNLEDWKDPIMDGESAPLYLNPGNIVL
jgi:hypothetical protein